jgi:hypothetical protein
MDPKKTIAEKKKTHLRRLEKQDRKRFTRQNPQNEKKNKKGTPRPIKESVTTWHLGENNKGTLRRKVARDDEEFWRWKQQRHRSSPTSSR